MCGGVRAIGTRTHTKVERVLNPVRVCVWVWRDRRGVHVSGGEDGRPSLTREAASPDELQRWPGGARSRTYDIFIKKTWPASVIHAVETDELRGGLERAYK